MKSLLTAQLSVSFYPTKQFSSRFKSLLAFLKHKMIISQRSICILNANWTLRYRSMFHLRAQQKVPLVYLSIFLVMAEFSTSSSARSPHPRPNLFPRLICLFNLLCVSAYFFSCPFLFLLLPLSLRLPRSYRRIALVGIAVCFRPRVNEEGALGCGVDLFFALIAIGVSHSWLTWPAWRNQIMSSTWFVSPRVVINSPQCELTDSKHSPHNLFLAYITFFITMNYVGYNAGLWCKFDATNIIDIDRSVLFLPAWLFSANGSGLTITRVDWMCVSLLPPLQGLDLPLLFTLFPIQHTASSTPCWGDRNRGKEA